MTIDKFGRHDSKRFRGVQGPKGEGFNLTPEGDYDVKSKRLRHVHIPVEGSDAVNLQYLHQTCLTSSGVNDAFDAGGKGISRVDGPKDADDVVTLRYFQDKTPRKEEGKDSYSFRNCTLKDVAMPVDEGDAVNLGHIRDRCLQYGVTNSMRPHIDARKNVIKNLSEPIDGHDASTKEYVDTKAPGGNHYLWDLRYRRLTNCSQPIDGNDAVTLDYFNNWCPKVDATESVWKFLSYRLSDVGEPLNLDDVVTKRYMKSALMSFGESLLEAMGTNTPVSDIRSFKIALDQSLSKWL